MPEFIVEPRLERLAIAVPAKVACTSLRMWLYEIGFGHPPPAGSIFQLFAPHTYGLETLPKTVHTTIAVHRDGVSRLRAVYDHRIKSCGEAPDYGIDHFARCLPEYIEEYPAIAHHVSAQSRWLGSQKNAFTHIVPLRKLSCIRTIAENVLGTKLSEIPRIHETKQRTPVGRESSEWFEAWTRYDSALGWDGETEAL